jgi:hypothetical protein
VKRKLDHTPKCSNHCGRPQKHVVMHGQIDTGARLCCECMDNLMYRLSFEEAKHTNMLDGALKYNKFIREHIIACSFVSPRAASVET